MKNKSFKNKRVLENYIFLTLLHLVNTLFYFFIYPYLIRVLGPESYGLYVFAVSLVAYFSVVITFGFDSPAARDIAIHREDRNKISDVVSRVYTAKLYLFAVVSIVFIFIIFIIPFLRRDWCLYIICYCSTAYSLLFPVWYYQGMEKMRFISYIQIGCKLLTLPFIFYFVTSSVDYILLAIITTSGVVVGAIISVYVLVRTDNVSLRIIPLRSLAACYTDAVPFFVGSFASIIKMQSIPFLLGVFFGMSSAAYYDLANKLIQLPVMVLANITNVLFPRVAREQSAAFIKKAVGMQAVLGSAACVFLVVFGKLFILWFAGSEMLPAYGFLWGLLLILPTWLVVGAVQSYIFVPKKEYFYVTRSQVLALATFFVCAAFAVFIKDAWLLVFAISLSGVAELLYNGIAAWRCCRHG